VNIDWLKELCDPYSPRLICQNPWRITLNGMNWVCVTDGRTMYAVIANDIYRPVPDECYLHEAKIISFLTAKKGTLSARVGALRDWAGPDTLAYCAQCDVDGFDQHKRLCGYCNGQGYVNGYDIRKGKIDGVLVNRFLIAKAFHNLPDGVVYVAANGNESVVNFIGDGWHVAVMPMVKDKPPKNDNDAVEFTAWVST